MSTVRQAASVEMDLSRRLERGLAKAGDELDWKVGERVRRQVRLEAALAVGGARCLKAAAEMSKIAARLRRAGSAREMARLAALWRLRGHACASRDVRELLNEMVEALRPAVPFEGATAFVFEKESARLTPVVVAGSHVDLIPDIHFDCGAGFSSWVAKTRRPVLLSSFREDPIGVPVERPASFLSVPLLVEDDLVAVLNFAHRRPGTFTTADRDLVLLAGRIVSPALSAPARSASAPGAWSSDPHAALTTRTA
jgi:GAF domain-containing protein